MSKTQTEKDGYIITEYGNGTIVKMLKQPVKEKEKLIVHDTSTMTAKQFYKIILERLGVPCK